MIQLQDFLRAVEDNVKRIRVYHQPGDGENGECDCIGLIIGSKRLAGGKWGGLHGSNYAFRNQMHDTKQINSINDLFVGEIVYKAREPGDEYYDLPDRYFNGHDYYNGDIRDYYHVGVVTKLNPLEITHCTSPGPIERDSKLGKWKYGGKLKDIDYGEIETPGTDIGGEDMTNTTVFVGGGNLDAGINMRKQASINSALIAKIPQNTEVEMLGKGSQWTRVRYNGIEGYVMNKFIIAGASDDMVPVNSVEERLADLERRVTMLENQVGFG